MDFFNYSNQSNDILNPLMVPFKFCHNYRNGFLFHSFLQLYLLVIHELVNGRGQQIEEGCNGGVGGKDFLTPFALYFSRKLILISTLYFLD